MTNPTTQDAFFERVSAGDEAQVKTMLAADRTLANARAENGASALMLALYRRQPAIASQIRAVKESLDVFEAAALGEIDTLRFLLDADGSLARATSADGATAMHFACFFGREAVVTDLLSRGADLGAVAPAFGNVQPLHSAAAARSATIVKHLLDAGADANVKQAGGYTALHSAAMHGDAEMAQALLGAGADPSLTTDDGKTAEDMAREAGHEAIIAMLR